MPAGDIDAHGDRFVGLVRHNHALAHPAGTLARGVHGRERLRSGRRGPVLGTFGAFLQAPRAALDRLRATYGIALGLALLGRARLAGAADVHRARFAPALLGGELLDGLDGRRGPPGRLRWLGSLLGLRLRLGGLRRRLGGGLHRLGRLLRRRGLLGLGLLGLLLVGHLFVLFVIGHLVTSQVPARAAR